MTTTMHQPGTTTRRSTTPPRADSADGADSARQRIVLPGSTLLLLLALRTLLLFAGDGVIAGLAGRRGQGAMVYANVSVVAVDVVTLAVLARLLRQRGLTFRSAVGRVRRRRDLLLALPVTVALVAAFVAASYLADLVVYAGPPPAEASAHVPLWLGVWSVTIVPVTAAVAEELLYRGVALRALRHRLPAAAAVLVSSLFFGLQHAALSVSSPADMLARVLTTFLVGIVLAVLALRLRSLLPLVVAHWAVDVLGLGLPMLVLALR